MKIAIIVIIPTPIRNNLFELLSNKLGYKNLKVFYLTKTTKENFNWDINEQNSFQEIFLPKISPNFLDKIAFLGFCNPSIIKELNKYKPDILVINGYVTASNILAFIWAKLTKTPYIMTGVMEISSTTKKKHLSKIIKDIIIKAFYFNAKYVLSIGTSSDKWCEYYKIPTDKIIKAPYSNDNSFFMKNSKLSVEEKSCLKEKYNIPSNNTVFITVSRLIPLKQIDNLIAVFKKLENKYNNITLLIVGNGEQEASLKQLAQPSEQVIFTGGLQKPFVAKMYGLSDCFILNSNSETWGLVVNEALASSLPVIVTNAVNAHYDLVKNGENGFVIDYKTNNSTELFQTMEKIINMTQIERQLMQKTSYEIISKWSYKETVEGYLKAFNNINTNI